MSDSTHDSPLRDKAFLVLLVAVSLAFGWILWPFYGATLWATILAIVFAPVHRRLLTALPVWPNLAALVTLLIIVTIVLLPLALTAGSLASEATSLTSGCSRASSISDASCSASWMPCPAGRRTCSTGSASTMWATSSNG